MGSDANRNVPFGGRLLQRRSRPNLAAGVNYRKSVAEQIERRKTLAYPSVRCPMTGTRGLHVVDHRILRRFRPIRNANRRTFVFVAERAADRIEFAAEKVRDLPPYLL